MGFSGGVKLFYCFHSSVHLLWANWDFICSYSRLKMKGPYDCNYKKKRKIKLFLTLDLLRENMDRKLYVCLELIVLKDSCQFVCS